MSDSPLNDIQIGKVTADWAKRNQLECDYAPTAASTNEKAKKFAFEEKALENNLVLYVCEQQSAGKGRGQNKWLTASPGSTLLSSWSFLLNVQPQPTLSPRMGLALYRALTATWPYLQWSLKAPNDIYIGDKKVAGLLIETVSQGEDNRLIVGLGLNVFAHPKEVESATSLLQEMPGGVPLLGDDWISFLDRWLFEMSDAVSRCLDELSQPDQRALLHTLNLHPLLKEKYIIIEADGSLVTQTKKINWMEL